MTNEELSKRISDVAYDYGHDICYLAADRIEQLQSKLDKAVAALTALGGTETSGGGQASVMAFHAREALAEIKGK